MDFAADFAVPLPLMVIAEMIGIPAADWPRFRQWSEGILKLSDTVAGKQEARPQRPISKPQPKTWRLTCQP